MEVTELTESMLNDMSEDAISNLWDVVTDSMLDLKKHL